MRPQTESSFHTGLRHQPSLLSLFAPTPPPPYSQPATAATEYITTSPSEAIPGFSPPGHLRAPYIMSTVIPDTRSTSQAIFDQRGQRSQAMPAKFNGLTALFTEQLAMSQDEDVQTISYSQQRQSWDVPPTPVTTYGQPLRPTMTDGLSRQTQLSPSFDDRQPNPMPRISTHDTAWNQSSADSTLAEGIGGSWSQPTVLEIPSLSGKASDLSMLYSYKAMPSATVREIVHELSTDPPERETLFELEGSIPVPSPTTQGRSSFSRIIEPEGRRPALVGPWSLIPLNDGMSR